MVEILPVQAIKLPALLPIQAMKLPDLLTMQAMKLQALTTTTATTRSNDTYIYGVGKLSVLAIGVCVFFSYNASQAKNKKTVNEKQDQQQNEVICFRKIVIINGP